MSNSAIFALNIDPLAQAYSVILAFKKFTLRISHKNIHIMNTRGKQEYMSRKKNIDLF